MNTFLKYMKLNMSIYRLLCHYINQITVEIKRIKLDHFYFCKY